MRPHKYRRSTIHFWILLPIAIIVVILFMSSCRPQRGRSGTRGMSGYSNIDKSIFETFHLGWLKCRETGKVILTDTKGNAICTYYETPSICKEQ